MVVKHFLSRRAWRALQCRRQVKAIVLAVSGHRDACHAGDRRKDIKCAPHRRYDPGLYPSRRPEDRRHTLTTFIPGGLGAIQGPRAPSLFVVEHPWPVVGSKDDYGVLF